jgi:hypothetical protein
MINREVRVLRIHTQQTFTSKQHTNSIMQEHDELYACNFEKQKKFLLAQNFALQRLNQCTKSWVVTNLPPLK